MPVMRGVIRQLQTALAMGAADYRDFMAAGEQCAGEFIGTRPGRPLRGGEMLMEIKEAQLI